MEILRNRQINSDEKVIVLGNFDGIHKGHRVLIDTAKDIAKEHGLKSAIFTFNRHPSYVLANKEPVPLILTKYEKEKVLESVGLDYYIEYPFTVEFSKYEPEMFVEEILVKEMNAKYLVVGSDYRFGKKGAGNVELLRELADQHYINLQVVEKIIEDGREISSSWIRKELAKGHVKKANQLLGRDHVYIGNVVRGEQIGRTIGFPTANLVPTPNKILPPYGVYSTEIEVDNKTYKGLTNIGCKPTVSGKSVTVETYILDFDEMIYGKEIIIHLKDFLRPETKFHNLRELKEQINKDLDKVKSTL